VSGWWRRLISFVAVVGIVWGPACSSDDGEEQSDPEEQSSDTAPTTTAPVPTTASPATVASTSTAATSPSTDVPPPPACSAAGLSWELPEQAALPEAVARTRQAIVDAAIACDWRTLSDLAGVRDDGFVYNFGEHDDPVGYWQSGEPSPDGPLRAMVIVLRAPFRTFEGEDGSGFLWPDAFDAAPLTEAHRFPLVELYSEGDFATFREYGGYIGWRVGIDSDGTWRFFVAGD
jgi:hypothetical protein